MTIATLLLALIATPTGDATGEPLLLDFHASWCGPCQQMRPAIKLLIQKGYQVKSVDVDNRPTWPRATRSRAFPRSSSSTPRARPWRGPWGRSPPTSLRGCTSPPRPS